MFSPMQELVYDDDGYPRRRYPQQVPAFGSWDCFQDVDDLSRCFEAARQAGYIRYAADRDLYVAGDLYEDHAATPTMIVVPGAKVGVVGGFEDTDDDEDDDEPRKAGKEKSWVRTGDEEVVVVDRRWNPKPVDEDLYKISPHLLHSIKSNSRRRTRSTKKKKKKKGLLMRLFTSCLVPCAS